MDTETVQTFLEEISAKLTVIASNQAQIGVILMATCGVVLGFLAARELLMIWTR